MPDIECQWMRDRRLLVNPDGQVLPCCYFANSLYSFNNGFNLRSSYTFGLDPAGYNTDVLKEYNKVKDRYNIFKRPLEDIINDDWYTKTLPDSWEDEEKTCTLCIRHCTKNE